MVGRGGYGGKGSGFYATTIFGWGNYNKFLYVDEGGEREMNTQQSTQVCEATVHPEYPRSHETPNQSEFYLIRTFDRQNLFSHLKRLAMIRGFNIGFHKCKEVQLTNAEAYTARCLMNGAKGDCPFKLILGKLRDTDEFKVLEMQPSHNHLVGGKALFQYAE